MKKLTLTFALALLGAAAFNTAATASAPQGDFILGFAQSGGSKNVEVDLGSISNFLDLSGGTTVNLTEGSTSAGQTGAFNISDLTGTFPSGNIYTAGIGVAVNTNATTATFYATVKDGVVPKTAATNSSINSKVTGLDGGFTVGTGGAAAGSTDAIPNSNSTGAFSTEIGTSGFPNVDWSDNSNFTANGVTSLYNSTGSVVFDLYSIPTTANGAVSEIGFFTLYGAGDTAAGSLAGDLTFTAASVPEPSTYALMGLGLVGLFGLRRWMALNA